MAVGWKSVLSRGTVPKEPPKRDLPEVFRELRGAGEGVRGEEGKWGACCWSCGEGKPGGRQVRA